MQNGVTGARAVEVTRRAWTKDALGAIALVEGATSEQVIVATGARVAFAERNAFEEPVRVETLATVAAAASRFAAVVGEGKRAALVATAHDLTTARETWRALRAKGVGAVVHAIAERGAADAWALADLGWGVLFASGLEESIDLTLVARRAAEDSGTPFFVVHERPSGVRHVEGVLPPSRDLVTAFLGAPRHRSAQGESARPAPSEPGRAFSERVPFALGSAMRELESLTGRRHDVIERIPAGDAPAVLVALGELGDSMLAGVERLRANGHEVGAIKVVALRPFPGARLVKAMQRVLALTVLETTDEHLAQSNPLTREVKAAFADAITWAPDYPGIGRIPRIVAGVVAESKVHALEAMDLDAVVHNMLEGERGRRSFVLGEGEPLSVAPGAKSAHAVTQPLSMRGFVRDAATAEACAELCTAVVSSALGLHVRASVRVPPKSEGDRAFAFDLLGARERPRGAHAPHVVRLVALESADLLLAANPLERLGDDGVLASPSLARSADGVWGEIPAYAKAVVFDRRARVVGFAPVDEADARARTWLTAATFAGLALAAAGSRGRPVDASLVGRETAEALRGAVGPSDESLVTRGADLAKRAYEAHVEVPRATVERDPELIQAGRRDTRASQAPR